MTQHYTPDPGCKDPPENPNALKPIAAASSGASEQITPNTLAARAIGLALVTAGCGIVALAVALNTRPLLADGITAAALLDAAPLAVATATFAGSPSASLWLWQAGHRWAAVFALALALGSGAASLTNLAGSALAPRLAAAADARGALEKRADARRQIDADRAELAGLNAAMPDAPGRASAAVGAEIEALLASRRDLDHCEAKWLPSPSARGVCIRVGGLRAEYAEAAATEARAQRWAARQAELEARIAQARRVLDGTGARPANPDAIAVVELGRRLGWTWDAETVDLLKSVLVAFLFEASAAMAFLLAGAVMDRPRTPWTAAETHATAAGPRAARASAPSGPSVPLPEGPETPQIRPLAGGTGEAGVPAGPGRDAAMASGEAVLQALRARGGSVAGTQRALAQMLDVPRSTLNRTLRDLQEAGAVRLITSSRGTGVTLIDEAAA